MNENKHTPEPLGHELKRLAEKVKGWSSCNAAWSIVDEDDPEYLTAAVGAIGEDDEEYPVAIVDCDNYFAGIDSLHLANFYAAANPQAVLEIIKQRDELLAALEGLTGDIQALIGESCGVSGLHMNGDIAPWDELESGGRFERLTHLPCANAAIARVKGEQ